MADVSEYLTVIPRQYLIVRQIRHKYRCGCCHGEIVTAPALPRIKPGSSYGDELIIDAALSKYCDLIPMGRYSAMAARQGLIDFPPHSLIQTTHYLAEFMRPVIDRIKKEILSFKVLLADETPHRMLEGDPKTRWYLWGFSGPYACYFECHNTRAGSVARGILMDSVCEVLLSDVYSGYDKATKEVNEERRKRLLSPLKNAYCNAHSRRNFKEASVRFKDEATFFLENYRKIYKLESEGQKDPEGGILSYREKMKPFFEVMKKKAEELIEQVSSKSKLYQACRYFIENFEELTLFLSRADIPIDNNAQERNLRSHVLGRKTWYGTHSKRGAETSANMFTLVESCKINKINPRQYFRDVVAMIHSKQDPLTPHEYKKLKDLQTGPSG